MSTSNSRPLPRPLHLVSNTADTSRLPLSVTAHGPLSAPLCQTKSAVNDIDSAKSKPHPRRQSSISYNTGLSKARLPPSGLGRRSSLGSNIVSSGEASRSDENGAPKVTPQHDVRETEPVTLAERHADLLRFIAQKESKCLELRTQLVQHEADLLLLKRKWERIVSKGLPSSVRTELQTNVGSDMLDGIREGVQNRLGKVFAVLEPSMAGPSSSSQPQPQPPTPKLNSKMYSQRSGKDSTSSGKRASISTTSSGSTRDRSSLSGSRSSSSSLFDELPSPDRYSCASSAEGKYTACSSMENDEACRTRPRSHTTPRSSNADSPAEMDTELPIHKELSKSREPGSYSNLSHLPFPFPATVTSDSFTPLSKQMSNWVPPGLNKKWEELKGSETLSKQSKRASVLLSDVLAVLAPPVPRSPSTTYGGNEKQLQLPSQRTLDSALVDFKTSGAGSVGMSPPLSSSLLDEKDECDMGEVLQPQVKVPGVPKAVDQIRNGEDNDEEWNW